MSDKNLSPTTSSRKAPIKTRRKLPFSENIISSPEVEWSKTDKDIITSGDSPSLTPRRTTPLSERQQIALLCRLSVSESPTGEPSEEGRCSVFYQKRNERGETPLHLSTIKGDFSKVCELLKQGVNVNTADFAGWTPLHEACNYGWFKIAKLLIQYGANVNALGLDKFTPLHDAAINKHEDIVLLLLKNGANPLQENVHHKTPLDVARSEKIAAILREAVFSLAQEETSSRTAAPSVDPSLNQQASCEPTMRKNSPQTHQAHKGADKPTSPRLTLRFQSIRSRDDKSCSSAKANDISSSQPKYQSYCVTMETKGDVYDFRKEDATVSSTQNPTSVAESTDVSEAVSSTCWDDAEKLEGDAESSEKPLVEKTEPVASKVNGGRSSVDSNSKEATSDTEDSRRKRRKSNDSNQSRHKGHKSPSGKGDDQKSPKSRKRGSQSSSDTESEVEASANSADAGLESAPPKVPPLKIVIPSGSGSLEQVERSKVSSSKQALPYVVNTTASDTMDVMSESVCTMAGDALKGESKLKEDGQEEKFQRMTRSKAAMSGGTNNIDSNAVSSSSQKAITEGSGESSNEEQKEQPMHTDVHPRKRKLRQREAENLSQNPSSTSSNGEDSQQQQFNSYQMFLNIRKQIDKRHKGLLSVHPKAPEGFNDYLLNRRSYVLEGNAASRFPVPLKPAPQSLQGSMKNFFDLQEKDRYKLRLQHRIEREKLMLSLEQEILRVHARAARAMVNQTVPLSVCTILKDEEIYNILEDDKDKNVRTRYNGRLFLSWLQDVDDKWLKIKKDMLLRHHSEAESLNAVQKLDWEWKLKELALCDMRTKPVIDMTCVPLVHVSDIFQINPTTS